jgi:serine/threonine protein kinase
MDTLGDRYQILEQLGKKAGRKTFLATDLQTQATVVIKLLTFSKDFEWDDLKLFEREAETLKSLNHSAIPKYLDFFEVDLPHSKGLALVQSYIPAQSLEEQIKAGRRFGEPEVKQLATALVEILIYLHSQQPPVIHRDIKPSNILLGDRSGNSVGQVYLVDFGSVQTLAATEGGTITVVGTYGYMPPEQFGGRAVPASDLYSLGATLIYLSTGKHPAELPQTDLKPQFKDSANLNPALVNWLQWLTEPSLDKRPSSAPIALEELHQEQPNLSISKPQSERLHTSIEPAQIFWHACYRSTLVGMMAPISLISVMSASPPLIIAVVLAPLGAVLGILNGLVDGLISINFSSLCKKPTTYRFILAIASSLITLISIWLFIDLIAFNSSGSYRWLKDPKVTVSVVILCTCMLGASQWFSSWYLNEVKKVSRR